MKRPYEDEDGDELPERLKMQRRSSDESRDDSDAETSVRESDARVLRDVRSHFQNDQDLSVDMDRQLRETRQNYYASYMKKVMEKLPMGKNILSTLREEVTDCGSSGFFKMFSAAKMVVHSEMQCKKLKAFNAVFDMVNGLVGRYVHDNLVAPALSGYVGESQLDGAFRAYRTALESEDDQLELQCIAYLVQTEIEKKEVLKVPHPMFNRFSQQMKAVSQYVIGLLAAASSVVVAVPESPGRERNVPGGERFVELKIEKQMTG